MTSRTRAPLDETAPRADEAAPPGDRRAEQRRSILTAAIACFERDGFHGTSMQQICTEAGMSPGALYRYFRSKEELIAAIAADERADRNHLLDTLVAAPCVIDALGECLESILREPTLPTVRLGPELMAEAIRNPRLRDAIEPCEDESRDQLRAALGTAVAKGEIDPAVDLEEVMIMLQAIADGLILHHRLHPQWDVPSRMPAFTAMLRRMLAPREEG